MTAYAERPDLYQLSVAAPAFQLVATTDQDAALEAASRRADGQLTRRFTLPLLTWGEDLRQAVCDIAAYRLLKARGFNPSKGGADSEQLRLGFEDALKWLKQVGDGAVIPSDVQDSSIGGRNDTDAAGEQLTSPAVLSPSSSTSSPGNFWTKGSCTPGGVGRPRRRNW